MNNFTNEYNFDETFQEIQEGDEVIFSCDFETTTDGEQVEVWAWGGSEVGNTDNFIMGENIDSFFEYFGNQKDTKNHVAYFHNLKFDGNFIVYWLLTHGFTYCKDWRKCESKQFSTVISDMGQWYSLVIYFHKCGHNVKRLQIYDSLKMLPFSVKEIAKAFDLPIKKGEIDYNRHNVKCDITDEEIEYLKNDCEIVGRALNILFEQGNNKMTTASNAFADYVKIMGGKDRFRDMFPLLDEETDEKIRHCYKGGFTYSTPSFQNKTIGEGSVYDVNSLYPSVMHSDCHKTFMNGTPLPYGEPLYFEGKYPKNKDYPLFMQVIRCDFELKKNHIPTIQIKKSIFCETDYLTSSNNETPVLYLTNVDLKLFFEHYEVFNIEFLWGYMFKSSMNLFKTYVNKWIEIKNEATRTGNKGLRTLAKLMLNSLYGRFALNPRCCSKYPIFNIEENKVNYKMHDVETRESVYVPVGAFVTAWARYVTITSAQKVYERFLYADTDSLHLIGFEEPPTLWIDAVELGAWKHESNFLKAKYLRAKRYIEEIKTDDGSFLQVTCAGMPKSSKEFVTFDNFVEGTTFGGKLVPKIITGGVKLVETEFTLKG